jgi:O-methyltransferase involved in polyketide biosynthesis
VVLEGVSMYLDRDANARVATSLGRAMRHVDGRLWVDVVAQSVIGGTTGAPEAEAFAAGMAQLGEPFVFGPDDPAEFFTRDGRDRTRRQRHAAPRGGEPPAPRTPGQRANRVRSVVRR